MLGSYRGKLIASFSFFMLIGLLITLVSLTYNQKVRQLDFIILQAERVNGMILMDNRILGEFFSKALTQSSFHQKKNSPSFDQHKELKQKIHDELDLLIKESEKKLGSVPHSLSSIKTLLIDHELAVDEMKGLMLKRGFRQYGAEGVMRSNIHKLERIPGFELQDVLSLRRREKDYIIRNDPKYIQLLLAESRQMIKKLIFNTQLTNNQKEIATYHLNEYTRSFQKLVELDTKMGLRSGANLKAEIDVAQQSIQDIFQEGIHEIEEKTSALYHNFNLIFCFILFVIFFLGILSSLYFANFLTKNINWLSESINRFIKDGFTDKSRNEIPIQSKDEIGQLIQNFFLLKDKISSYIQELKREKEAADLANQSKSLFLANMSHEIRTPMNGVIGITELLESSEMNPTQKNYLEVLKISSHKLLGIINDILDFSKIESGNLTLEKTTINVSEEIQKVMKVLEVKAQSKKLYLKSEIDAQIPLSLVGDPIRFNQILFNIVGNAIKFTEQGGVNVKAKALAEEGNAVRLQFQIIDTGIGISAEAMSNLFSPFSQADESTTRKFGGTGLGLAITQQLVELMEGEIRVESQEEEGSIFVVEIPFERVNVSAKHKTNLQQGFQSPISAKVLLVEDNKINQKIAGMMLKKIGCEYKVCENGKEAVEEVKKNVYDLVFMDIQMPVMNGFEATSAIRQLQQNKIIPYFSIVALTANATMEDKKMALDAGMDEFVTKPIRLEQLKEVIRRFSNPLPQGI